MAAGAELKARSRARIEERGEQLVGLSRRIHGHPELAFAEHHAVRWVGEALAENGFDVEPGAGGLETAFVATAGSGPLVLSFCAEYDALRGVGHACGHNLIAAAAVAAGTALAACADDLDVTVKVIGTPAEEGGGGKAIMLEHGAFDGVHAAMMVHPYPTEMDAPMTRAAGAWRATFTGRGAHAGMAPHDGRNAGDALTVAQVAIGLLRQQLPSSDSVQCVVTDGGGPLNIIPASASLNCGVRSATLGALDASWGRVRRCLEAGALASETTVEVEPLNPVYTHFVPDADLVRLYRDNAEAVGRELPAELAPEDRLTFSTDMANVSLRIPAIHPMVAIDAGGASNHQPGFRDACVTPAAERALIFDGGLALAATAIDAATHPDVRERLLAGRRAPHPAFPVDEQTDR